MQLLRKLAAYSVGLFQVLMMIKVITETRLLVDGTSGSYKSAAAWFIASLLTGLLSCIMLPGWAETLRQFRAAFTAWDNLVNKPFWK